jgi:hypothetical protein
MRNQLHAMKAKGALPVVAIQLKPYRSGDITFNISRVLELVIVLSSYSLRTYTIESKDASREQTPVTIMEARVSFEPVPP